MRRPDWFTSPEERLLLAVCRKALGGSEALPTDIVDKSAFQKLCRHHRLVLLANKFLPALQLAEPRLVASHLRLAKLSLDLNEAFNRAGVTHVFLKGPVLAETLFPGQVLRYSSDLDLLVKVEDMPTVHAAMSGLGFVTKKAFADQDFMNSKDIVYARPGFPHKVEMHWRTYREESLVPKLDRVISCEMFHGRAMPVLEVDLNAIYLCFHAAKHHWQRLRWLVDIAIFVERKGLSWETLRDRADGLGVGVSVSEAAFLARELFAADTIPVAPRVGQMAVRRFRLVNDPERSRLGTLRMNLYKGFLFSKPSSRLSEWRETVRTYVLPHLLHRYFSAKYEG